MDKFAQFVQEWQTFYATIAASSATLVGLLFVAIAVNPTILTRDNNGSLRLLARQTFTSFLYMIAIALTFLIPRADPLGLGLPLLCIGIVGLLYTTAELRSALVILPQVSDKQAVWRRFAIKFASFVILIIVAIVLLVRGETTILWWMIAPMFLLLMSASLNTWILLIAVQEASTRH
jgi:hypothetical protein